VAHGDARWFALNRKVKLPAAAGGASGGHGSAPWLSIWAECRLDFNTMHHGQRNRVRFALAYIGSLKQSVRAAWTVVGTVASKRTTVDFAGDGLSANDRPIADIAPDQRLRAVGHFFTRRPVDRC
jgi:hypothetical protein